MGVSMVLVTVSGHPGSGTSTLVKGLAETFGWDTLNGGDVFRGEARRRDLSLHEFEVLCKDDEAVDRSLDALLQDKMVNDTSIQVVESRLAGWWAHRNGLDCLRIWLDVSVLMLNCRIPAVIENQQGLGVPVSQFVFGKDACGDWDRKYWRISRTAMCSFGHESNWY